MCSCIERYRFSPMQRLRQLEPSWLRSGQTTSLFASVIEKDDVRDDLGGILEVSIIETPPSDVGKVVEGCLRRGVDDKDSRELLSYQTVTNLSLRCDRSESPN